MFTGHNQEYPITTLITTYYPKMERQDRAMYNTESEMEANDKYFTRLAHQRRETLTKHINAEETACRKLQRVLRDANNDDEEKYTKPDIDSANVILDMSPWAQEFAEWRAEQARKEAMKSAIEEIAEEFEDQVNILMERPEAVPSWTPVQP